jgi:aldehyde:ferredoxin oxidoreductase
MAKSGSRGRIIMKFIKNFYNMKMNVVDLAKSSTEILPLSSQLIVENIGGAAVNLSLFDRYRDDDPLVLGVGPLTGSFAPASCLLVATFYSPMSGMICHIPLMLKAGPEMKFSGIDFMIIKGVAPRPQTLYVYDGIVKLLPADHIQQLNIPEAMNVLRQLDQGFPRFTILTGPAADNGVFHAAISMGLWGSLDKSGLACWMGTKNLKAIIFKGTGGLMFGQDNLAMGRKMAEDIGSYSRFKKEGFITIMDRIDVENEVKKIIGRSKKKDLACYNCPFACTSYVEFKWRDPRLKRDQKKKEGMFLLDHTGFIAMARKRQADALVLMRECLRFGLDPSAVAGILPKKGTLETSLDIIAEMAKAADKKIKMEESQAIDEFCQGNIPLKKYALFGLGIPPILSGDAGVDSNFWEKRVAMSMILGVCPILMLLFPDIDLVDLLKFVTVKNGYLESLQDTISSRIQLILLN